MLIFNRFIKKTAQKFGVQVSRRNARNSPDLKIVASLKNFEIDLVIDVGANEGQYAEQLIHAGYKGKIISFEPLESAWEILKKKSQKYPQWDVYERCAVGEEEKTIALNISENSVSSSICKVLPTHVKSAPKSVIIGTDNVPMIPLDKAHISASSHNCYLKIDTQGYEHNVLVGAENLLKEIKGIQLELSLIELYENQKLWREIHDKLENDGFKLWGVIPGFSDQLTGQTLQFDGIFFRQNLF